MGDLARISHTHDQIIDWLLANPNQPMSVCAAEFGYTAPWLSTLIHSDLFQAKLQERQETIFGEVALSVKDRITALAHDSLRRLHEKVQTCDDVDQLVSASELAVKALGFGPTSVRTPGVTVNFQANVVTKDVLAEARLRMEHREVKAIEGPAVVIPLAIERANLEGE
jgi:hypothetical protein